MLSSSQSLSSLSAVLPLGLGIRERRTGRQRGFIPLCRPVFLFPGRVQNRAICGTIEVDIYRLKGAYGCSCLNWSARGCSGRWRGRTGHFMQSCCSCCGRCRKRASPPPERQFLFSVPYAPSTASFPIGTFSFFSSFSSSFAFFSFLSGFLKEVLSMMKSPNSKSCGKIPITSRIESSVPLPKQIPIPEIAPSEERIQAVICSLSGNKFIV